MLDGAQGGQLQVLLLLVPGAVPGVVGQVHERVGPALALVPHHLAYDPGQDVLVADERRIEVAAGTQGLRAGALRQMRRQGRPFIEEGKPVAERDVLAESEQLDLVVVVADLPVGPDHQGAVPGLLALEPLDACDDGDGNAAGDGAPIVSVADRAEVVPDLRPDDEVGAP